MKIIPVADKSLLREYGIFFSPNTLHKWHSQKVYPALVKKIVSKDDCHLSQILLQILHSIYGRPKLFCMLVFSICQNEAL